MKVPDAAKLNIVWSKVCTKRKVKHNRRLAGLSSRLVLADLSLVKVPIKGQNPLFEEVPDILVSSKVLSESEIFLNR